MVSPILIRWVMPLISNNAAERLPNSSNPTRVFVATGTAEGVTDEVVPAAARGVGGVTA